MRWTLENEKDLERAAEDKESAADGKSRMIKAETGISMCRRTRGPI